MLRTVGVCSRTGVIGDFATSERAGSAAAVGLVPVDDRPLGHDAARVHALVAAIVVLLDVEEVDGLRHARVLVQLARVRPQVRVVDETLEVALEMADVDRIEARERGEQAEIRLGDPLAREIALA